jgi:hypothetical protein
MLRAKMKPSAEPELDKCGPPLAEADVASLERFLALRLPPEYRAFLLQYNGGRPKLTEFPVPSHPESVIDLELFFGVTREKASDNLEWNYKEHRPTLGKHLLAIGRTPANDLLALVLSGDKRHSIVFYDVIEEDPDARLHDVAESFAKFMASLKAA